MIDTVVLRLHDLKKYAQVAKSLDLHNNNGYKTSFGAVTPEDFFELLKANKNRKTEKVEILQHKRKGDFLFKTQVGKQLCSSSHYSFTYFINYSRDFIEFNFSIPKYQFGTNIIQFIEHNHDNGFNMYSSKFMDHNIKKSFILFSNFIKSFFRRELTICTIDFKDLEVNRIDVCFNQVFNSREEALLYLEYQKKLKKKHARNEDGVMHDWATSLMYKTRRYSAKIYHKGTEYEKHDKKEHLKINIEKRKEYFKTEKFQEFSDKILRYELTLRCNYLNYIHKKEIFRKTCPVWKSLYRGYLIVERINEYNKRVSKQIGKLKNKDQQLKYMFKHPYKKATQDIKQYYKIVSEVVSRSRKFMIDVDSASLLFNLKSVPYENDFALFSKDLFQSCMNRLVTFINEYQIKELPDLELLKNKIIDFNQRNKIKLPVAEMLHFYRHLLKHGSFKEAVKHSDYSRATLYRYIARFALIGITEANLRPIDKFYGIPAAPTDFRRYHNTLLDNSSLLRGIKMPNLYFAF